MIEITFDNIVVNFIKPINEALATTGINLQTIDTLLNSDKPEQAAVPISQIIIVIITKTAEILNTNGIFDNISLVPLIIERLTQNNEFNIIITSLVSLIVSLRANQFDFAFSIIATGLVSNIVALVGDIIKIIETSDGNTKKEVKRNLKTALKIKN